MGGLSPFLYSIIRTQSNPFRPDNILAAKIDPANLQ